MKEGKERKESIFYVSPCLFVRRSCGKTYRHGPRELRKGGGKGKRKEKGKKKIAILHLSPLHLGRKTDLRLAIGRRYRRHPQR